MTFNEFQDEVMQNIKYFLPEEYQNAEVRIHEVDKINESYTGLAIEMPGSGIAPSLNLDRLYEQYMDGSSLYEVMQNAANELPANTPSVDKDMVLDYDQAKEHLFVRVSSADDNPDVRAKAPHKDMDGLMVTYHVEVGRTAEGVSSTIVTNELLKHYGISAEQLHADAIENSERLFPSKFANMNDVMREMMGGGPFGIPMDIEDSPLNVITNSMGVNGAAALFYNGMMDRVGDKLEGDYFILPSSVHEVLAIADNGEMSHRELEAMVSEINATEVSPQDKLSDEVYHYDTKDRVFERASTFEKRQMEKFKSEVRSNIEKAKEQAPEAKKTESEDKPKRKSRGR